MADLETVYLMQRNVVKLNMILDLVRQLEGCELLTDLEIDEAHKRISEDRDALSKAIEEELVKGRK